MKILITGAKGQLGTELIKQIKCGCSELGAIPEAYKNAEVVGIDIEDCDLTDKQAVFKILREGRFDVVINCAAFTNVDGCEANCDAAFKVNSLAVRHLAEACEVTKTVLAHVSTDYVFSGDAVTPYREYDVPSPQNVYGKTKHLGEQYLREACSRYFIVRTSWLYGYIGGNFVKTILRLARENKKVTVVNDQLGNPTSAVDVAHHILKIIDGGSFGIYHCTNNGICSWHEFAGEFVRLAGIDAEVLPCTTQEFIRPAKRPAYSALDNMMLRATVGDEMRDWHDAIKQYMENLEK
ncbi:MAG: dTDP-4-dehydrorhamnose reductase [Oscillospiraceae bacterium]